MVVLPRENLQSLRITPMFNGQDLSSATGFLSPGPDGYYLVTNWHVLSGRNAITQEILSKGGATPDALRISHPSIEGLGHWTDRIEPLRNADSEAMWREHPIWGSLVDVAAIHLTQTEGITADPHNPAQINSDVYIAIGERLSVIGFPFGVTSAGGFPIWTQGFVATEPELLFADLLCFLIDSLIGPPRCSLHPGVWPPPLKHLLHRRSSRHTAAPPFGVERTPPGNPESHK